MENSEDSRMKINWVVADHTVLPPDVDVTVLKDIAAIWGSWRTWRGCGTDNVICNDAAQARDLIKRRMNEQCNLYIPNAVYRQLDRPGSVRLYEGQFTFEIDNPDELIGIQLVSGQSDIVLLMGFDWRKKPASEDRLAAHRAANYCRFVQDAIAATPAVQWVLVDHPGAIVTELAALENLTQDSLENVIELLRPH
jgi:hypothetical protein